MFYDSLVNSNMAVHNVQKFTQILPQSKHTTS